MLVTSCPQLAVAPHIYLLGSWKGRRQQRWSCTCQLYLWIWKVTLSWKSWVIESGLCCIGQNWIIWSLLTAKMKKKIRYFAFQPLQKKKAEKEDSMNGFGVANPVSITGLYWVRLSMRSIIKKPWWEVGRERVRKNLRSVQRIFTLMQPSPKSKIETFSLSQKVTSCKSLSSPPAAPPGLGNHYFTLW